MSEVTKMDEALAEASNDADTVISEAESRKEQKLSEREFKMAMARAYKERNEKIKQNKAMIEEMNLEVAYWKANADLLRYRFEKMDFFIKNQELEPLYLQKVEELKLKEQQAAKPESPILS